MLKVLAIVSPCLIRKFHSNSLPQSNKNEIDWQSSVGLLRTDCRSSDTVMQIHLELTARRMRIEIHVKTFEMDVFRMWTDLRRPALAFRSKRLHCAPRLPPFASPLFIYSRISFLRRSAGHDAAKRNSGNGSPNAQDQKLVLTENEIGIETIHFVRLE